jgi:hypothetical protein
MDYLFYRLVGVERVVFTPRIPDLAGCTVEPFVEGHLVVLLYMAPALLTASWIYPFT